MTTQTTEIIYLNPRAIEPNRENVRRDIGDLVGLAETIREHGVLQPLGVVRQGSGFRVVYGDRRREAAILVGLDRVPCLLLGDLDEGGRLVRNILENLQRLDLNDLDKARAFARMLDALLSSGLERADSLDAMTRRLGLSAAQIRRYLGLLDLAPGVQHLISQGELGITQAQHLRQLSPEARQEEVGRLAADEHLSAAELAKLAAALSRNPNIDPAAALMVLRRGDTVADLGSLDPEDTILRLASRPSKEEKEEDIPLGRPDDEEADGSFEEERQVVAPTGTLTRDGNRVRKVHSLDAFVDEVDRLTRCAQDGDLANLVEADADGEVKLRLVAKQLAYLGRMVDEMAGVRN